MVFLDETASCPKTGDRKRGWSPIGMPCFDTQLLRRDNRVSVLPAMTIDGYLPDPLIIQGAVTMELFEDWVEHKLLPQLLPGQIVVMDNAAIHDSEVVKALCVRYGIELHYLPPYSPDLNPIEQSFNALKTWIKRHIEEAGMFRDFSAFMEYALRMVSIDGASGWFREAGYEVD